MPQQAFWRPCQKGRALSHPSIKFEHALPKGARPSKRGAPFQKVCALPKGARPSKRGAPFLTHWSKLNMPFQKGRALSKGACSLKRGAPFPFCQTVSQELRMDGGIAKPGSACRNWMRTHTHSATLVSCLSSSKLRCWRGCVVVDRSSQVQVWGAHLLLQQQVLGALPFPEERNWTRTHTHSAVLVSCLSSSKLRCWRGCVVVDRSSQVQVLSAHLLLQQQVLSARPPPEERTSSSYLSFPFLFIYYWSYFRICSCNISKVESFAHKALLAFNCRLRFNGSIN